MGHGDAACPVSRLHEQHAVDRGVGDLAVRVPVENQVDPRHLVRHAGRDVLTRDASGDGIVAGRPVEPGVDGHEHDRRTRGPDVGDRLLDLGNDVLHDDAAGQVVAIPDHGPRCGGAHDADAGLTALHHRPRRERRLAIGTHGIRCHEGKTRLADGALKERQSIVELVIADRRAIVPHRIHRGHHRVRGVCGRDPPRHICEGVALQQVAGVQENHAPGRCPTQRIDDGRSSRESTRRIRRVGLVIPAAQSAVYVRGARDDEIERVAAGARPSRTG